MSRGSFSGLSTVAAIMVTVVLCTAAVGQLQNPATCAQGLTPCATYLNSTNPPAECCTPLKKALTTQKECLCNLYKNPSVLNSFGINVTKALDLPKHCNISANISDCNTSSGWDSAYSGRVWNEYCLSPSHTCCHAIGQQLVYC